MNNEWLNGLKTLTPNEYQSAISDAEKAVLKDIDKPKKEQYKREGDGFNPIDFIRVLIFIAAFLISTLEGFKFVGYDSNAVISSFNGFDFGIPIDKHAFVSINQIGFVILAELTMIVMMISWRFYINKKEREGYYNQYKRNISKQFDKFFDFRLFLAMLSMSFILLVNFSSGMHYLLALMPAFIVIGLGYDFETAYTEWYLERKRVNSEYNKDFNEWQEINRDPTKHPKFDGFKKRSIWAKIHSKNSRYNIDTNVSGELKYLAVQNEIENYEWANYSHLKMKSEPEYEGYTEVETLKKLVDSWNGNEKYIETKNFVVDMANYSVFDKSTEDTQQFNSVGGLRRSLAHKIKQNGSV